jgi:hypothetical protein
LQKATDIFTLLNTVVDYYGDDKGVAFLIGCVNANGTTNVSDANTIWQNIDNMSTITSRIASSSTATERDGRFNSYDLIWNDIILGFLISATLRFTIAALAALQTSSIVLQHPFARVLDKRTLSTLLTIWLKTF